MNSLLASTALFFSLFGSTAFARPQTTSTSTACNNSPSLCSRSYANVTYLGAHDSAFISNSSNGYDISGNQYFNTTTQLNAGVRLLQSQIQSAGSSNSSSDLHLCHTSCSLLDAGTVESWLTEVKTWMDSNPNEVVTMLLVNGANADATTLGEIFTNSGITKYAYTPTSSTPSSWPTLQEMISADTRLVIFIASLSSNTGAEFLLNEFDYVWENNYDVTDASNFTCTPARPSAVAGSLSTAKSSGRMFLMNHFLDQNELIAQVPDVAAANTTNSPDTSIVGSLGYSASQCTSQYGAPPNYILVDWFNVGPAISTVDSLNGVTAATGREQVTTANLKVASSSSSDSRRTESSALALVIGFAVAASVGWI
ncbi:uncharacterized protein PV09_07905 [Verruconis gallopava]|uniref:Phosphatidylinositol-specific phospholipase C X domain-containing protein n=1 Tax=Verruconis gallopava TaxID=253628 RepID=A0A0D2A2I4_9PEZI|nr:uncharacterized protein PV09_07905 [Verruconis gallopava]KIW00550.1 hypothetical protein PV09_07905 [Verruconis gallopava]